ncbi:MAG: PEP-CTERM sorting domain-containing protein [Candidatus Methylumidiphilus sp.]
MRKLVLFAALLLSAAPVFAGDPPACDPDQPVCTNSLATPQPPAGLGGIGPVGTTGDGGPGCDPDNPACPLPEPETLPLFAIGAVGMLFAAARRKKN